MIENLPDIVRDAITAWMSSMHTAMPGIIQSYDAAKKTVQILPSVKMAFKDGTIVSMPVITDVPVIFPGTTDMVMQYPLKKGDGALIIVSEACLENWIGLPIEEVEPGDVRRFSLMDAFCIPGLFTPKAPGKVGAGDGLEIIYKDSSIIENDAGDILIASKGGVVNLLAGGNTEINGNTKTFVTYAALNTALETFRSGLLTSLTTTPIAGNGATQPSWTAFPAAIDISAAETTTVKTGG